MYVFINKLSTFIFALAVILLGKNTDVRAEASITEVCPRIVSRLAWGAEDEKSTTTFPNLPEFVVICHTVTPECRNISICSSKVRSIQSYHMNGKHWDDIGYNFLIGEDGAVYEGRGWDHVGAHSLSYNSQSISIAFIGTFRDRVPDSIALNVAHKLIDCGVSKGNIPREYKLVGHRQLISTISPGEKLFNEIKTWPRWTSNLNKQSEDRESVK